MNKYIYHIVEQGSWNKQKNLDHYTHPSLETEGFIHFSTEEQVLKVAEKFYSDAKDELLLLQIEVAEIDGEIIYEGSDSIGQDFPHLYKPLNIEAIIDIRNFRKDHETKKFIFPYA